MSESSRPTPASQPAAQALLAELGAAAYSPHRLAFTFNLDRLVASLSPAARAVFRLFANEIADGAQANVLNFYAKPWRDDLFLLSNFLLLDRSERQELLALFTFPLHELRHHVDFLTTPYGVRFHTLLAQEYLCFQIASPVLLERQEFITPGPVVSLAQRMDAVAAEIPPEWSGQWGNFLGTVERLIATIDTRGLRPDFSRVTPLDMDPYELLGRKFAPVDVYGRTASFTAEGHPGWYMRAATLLEGRAVIASLLWIIDTVGVGHDELGELLSDYVALNYPSDAPYDYRFLLDCAAWFVGEADADGLLRRSPEIIRAAMHPIDSAAWFALHAGYSVTDRGFAPENMFERFLVGVHALRYPVIPWDERPYPFAVLEAFEAQPEFNLSRTAEALEVTRQLLSAQMRSLSAIWQPDMRNHFEFVFGLLQTSLARREGLSMPAGAPADGNVVFQLPAEHLAELPFDYDGAHWVREWFRFRNVSLFKISTKQVTLKHLREQFGLSVIIAFCTCGALVEVQVPQWAPFRAVRCECGETINVNGEGAIHIATGVDGDE